MKIEIMTLCDAATDDRGKLNVLGAFDHVAAKQVPAVYPACALAIRIRFSRIEEGEHAVKVTFCDEDGKSVLPPLEAPVSVSIPKGEETAIANLIMNIQQLSLPIFGEYAIDLAVDNRAEGSLPLYVRQTNSRSG